MTPHPTPHTPTAQADAREAIRSFIQDELLAGHALRVQDDDDLLLSGLVDSMGAVRLIAHIETVLDTHIPPEDVVIEHFQTIDAMVNYLAVRGV